MREGIGAEVSAPPAFGTSVSLHKSHYSRPFTSHVPFIAVPPQPSIRRSIYSGQRAIFASMGEYEERYGRKDVRTTRYWHLSSS